MSLREPEILVVGVDGLIGSNLARKAEQTGIDWRGTSRAPKSEAANVFPLDLSNDDAIRNLSVRSRISYLCAAKTNLSECEKNPVETRKINVEQTLKIAQRLHELGSQVVFISTNLVFDGTQNNVPPAEPYSPLTEYGRQKADVEKALLDRLERVAIVRLTKVVHGHFALFQNWLTELKAGRVICPFSDMFFSPVEISVVTDQLLALHRSFHAGIFHLSGDTDISYSSAAYLLAKCQGFAPELIAPKTRAEAGFQQHSPRYSSLAYHPVVLPNTAEPVSVALERVFKSL